MEDNLSLPSCSDRDVISAGDTMFKVEKLNTKVNSLFPKYNLGERLSKLLDSKNPEKDFTLEARKDNGDVYVAHQKWFDEGIDCEILKIGAKGWQKGKIKINLQVTVEFCPDEPEIQQPESPLDDLRQIINEQS